MWLQKSLTDLTERSQKPLSSDGLQFSISTAALPVGRSELSLFGNSLFGREIRKSYYITNVKMQ